MIKNMKAYPWPGVGNVGGSRNDRVPMMEVTMLEHGLAIAAMIAVFWITPVGNLWGQQSLNADAVHDMQSKGQEFILLDVRSSADFQAQHIQGAINVPRPSILKAQLPKSKSLVLYCGNPACMLSYTAAQALAGNGYTNVTVHL